MLSRKGSLFGRLTEVAFDRRSVQTCAATDGRSGIAVVGRSLVPTNYKAKGGAFEGHTGVTSCGEILKRGAYKNPTKTNRQATKISRHSGEPETANLANNQNLVEN